MAFKCRKIKDAVAAEFGLSPKLIDSRIRTRDVARARMTAAYLCRKDIKPEVSFPWIGKQFGLDHSTILHSCREISLRVSRDPEFAAKVERCRQGVRP